MLLAVACLWVGMQIISVLLHAPCLSIIATMAGEAIVILRRRENEF